MEALMEEIKPVVTENYDFEYRDKPILTHFWIHGIFGIFIQETNRMAFQSVLFL